MYVIRFADFRAAIDPTRKLVKLSDPNLWKSPWPEGINDWQRGHEIRSEAIGISIFTSGAAQTLHYHEKTWEMYQVLEGSLQIAVKPTRGGAWASVQLGVFDTILLAPGTLHLVDEHSDHVTQVIQAPPALSDQIVLDKKEPGELEAARHVLVHNRAR